ncbi:D-xylose 1-dehydrogenase [Aureococcus anophagefferens]|nr:D-xylose 1-dehydrogenase [Aureococcus anophagefferens]
MARFTALLIASASALAPQHSKVQTRRELGSALVGIAGAFGAQAANAAAGESPKFSYSEGAMYGSDQKDAVYSPYSVYGKLGDPKAVYKKYNDKEVAFKKAMFADSSKRVAKTKQYIEKKSWEDVRSELERQVYNMRGTMNYLAAASGKPEATAAAKKFYQDMEEVNLLSKRKKQAAALGASRR